MKILGYLGSPKVNGITGKLLKRILEGAESMGAETKKVDLIKCNIEHCRGCCICFTKNPELPVGKCSIKDEMAEILQEYIEADGYIFATPVYDVAVTALMKKFLERKIALTYREKEAYAKIGEPRSPANFKKMASFLVTGNCGDDFKDSMGGACFEQMNGHLMLEQVWVVDECYVGGTENLSEEVKKQKFDEAYQIGIRLIEEINTARAED